MNTTTHHAAHHGRPAVLAARAALGAFGALCTFGLGGCDAANSKAAAPADTGAAVSVASVIEQPVTETQQFSGRLEAVEHAAIRARVGGFITAVQLPPGGLVAKGQLLFTIDARPYQAELNRAEAALLSARAKAGLARLELERALRLRAAQGIAEREYEEKAAALKELDANVGAARAQFDTARLNLAYTEVRAPFAGRVGKAEHSAGNLVDPATVLTSLVSQQRIYASFDGDEDSYLRLAARARQGRPVTVRVGLANEAGFPHEGRLDFVDNQLDPATGSVRLRAVFDNADQTLAPGLFVRVRVDGGGLAQQPAPALLIAERAVGTDQNRKFVYVLDARHHAQYRQVELGQSVDGLRIVKSGLAAGEQIVVNGLQRVRPDALLAPRQVAMRDGADGAPAEPGPPQQARAGATPHKE